MKARLWALALTVTLSVPSYAASPSPPSASEAFTLVAGRVLVPLRFLTADGRERAALAWLNMGTPKAALSAELRGDIGLKSGEPLRFRLGTVALEVPPDAIDDNSPKIDGEDALSHLFAPRKVEVILPARALSGHRLVLDYLAHRIALATPGGPRPNGIATPIRLDATTGLAAVDATVDGEPRSFVLDAGASYTWIRGDVAKGWIDAHPEWERAEGAVGASNMGLVDLGFEEHGTLLRLPRVDVGLLHLGDVGALGTAPLLCRLCDDVVGDLFWNGWAKNAPGPVAGWLGGNVLGDFQLTIDYPTRTAYWLRQRPAGLRPIDQVGITLVRRGPDYLVGGVVRKDGAAAVDGPAAGDRILAIDGRDPSGATSDDVREALGGPPGAHHTLTLDRHGTIVEVKAPVMRF